MLEERLDVEETANRQFVWGLRYIDDLVLRDRDSDDDGEMDERMYALQDANWNMVALCDDAGAVQQRFAYTPYGTPQYLADDFTVAADYYDWENLFTGQRFDASSGLYLYRMRFYHAELGRFLSRDPLEYSGEDLNLYRYVKNSPVNAVDPSGAWSFLVRQCLAQCKKQPDAAAAAACVTFCLALNSAKITTCKALFDYCFTLGAAGDQVVKNCLAYYDLLCCGSQR